MKLQNPGIKKASLRLLEVLYYHSSKLVSSLRELGHRQEIELGRYDHFEPQSGKDMSERILCPSIRRYCNEGHNVVSAKNMHSALKERLTSQGNDSVSAHSLGAELDLEINKIANFNSLHNFEFTQEGLRLWRAFNVGPNMFISRNKIVICPKKKTDLEEEISHSSSVTCICRRKQSDGDGDSNSGSPCCAKHVI